MKAKKWLDFNPHIRIPLWWPNLPGAGGLRPWLPSRGSVLFTLLVGAGLIWAQAVGAVPGAAPASPDVASTGTVAYQGRLADPAGAPLTGTYGMIFRLYAASTGGAPLWEEQWTGPNSAQVSDGLFNVMLGSLTPIPQNVMTGNSSLWLGITVGSDDEMAPRVQLGSVPFAVQAITVPDGSVTTEKIADGAVTAEKLSAGHEGFSYFTDSLVKPAGWQPLVVSEVDYNTFGASSYNTSTGVFTAPKAGYYRFMTYGFISTGGTSGERLALSINRDGSTIAVAGGQFSAGDTPGPFVSHVMHVGAGSTVSLSSFTPIDATFGGSYRWWFQGEYLGQ